MHRRSILFAALLLLTHQFFFSPTVKAQSVVNLAGVTTDTVIQDGQTLTGTLGTNVKISIADGATVTLDGVSINADGG